MLSQPGLRGEQQLELRADVARVAIEQLTSNFVQFNLYVSLLSTSDAALREVTFESLTFNDVPVYAAPVSNPTRLKAGHRTDLVPILLTVYYRDLDSVLPFEKLVRDGELDVKGSLTADADLTFLEHVALLARRARVFTSFRAQVPISLPGGARGRAVALAVFDVADRASGAIRTGVEAGMTVLGPPGSKELWRSYAALLLFVRTSFVAEDRAGQQYHFESTAAGFRISEREAILTKEALEPWKFDGEIAAELQSKNLRLDPAQYDIWVWPADATKDSARSFEPSQALRQSHHEVTIVRSPRDDNDTRIVAVSGGGFRKVRVHRRDSASNVALVALEPPLVPLPFPAKLDFQADAAKWGRLAVFRFASSSTTVRRAHPDLLFLDATRPGTAISLGTPVDASGFGSPLIGPSGIVGIVQSERGALSLHRAWQALDIAQPGSVNTRR